MKKILIVTITLMMVLTVTGCTGKMNSKTSACIVYSNRANCALPDIVSDMERNEEVKDVITQVAESFGLINAVCIDGNPEIVGTVSFGDIPEKVKKAGSEKIKKDAITRVNNLVSVASGCRANDPEADLLEGLGLAVRSVNTLQDATNKIIIVIDSGLSTSGLLQFQNNIINAEPASIVKQLKEKDAIPDFTDITVKFLHLGDVADPQEKLLLQQVKKLKEIWQAIVKAGNGNSGLIELTPNEKRPEGEFPKVTIIDLPKEEAIEYTGTSDIDISSPLVISERQVSFIGDSSEYVDNEAAMGIIKPIAEYLKTNNGLSILLVGTTAGDSDNSYTRELSGNRARAVKKTLVSLGVSEKRIKTLGMGCVDPWHISGAGTEGNLASQNRKVVLIDANSEIAKELL